MNSNNKGTQIFRTLIAVGVAGIGLAASVSSARADEWDKKTILTISEPIQVRETLLVPGQYVFKLLNSQSDRHIVQIFTADQTKLIDTELAIPNYRLQPTEHSRFAFWETPEGSAKALRAWFYPGDNFGQEFTYPKHLAMLNTTTITTHYKQEEPVAMVEPAPAAPAAPEPAQPEPVAAAPAPTPAEPEQPLIAQNTPPPSPLPPTQTPASTLPKTATWYPAIGLAGLVSLSGFGLMRRRNSLEN